MTEIAMRACKQIVKNYCNSCKLFVLWEAVWN